MGSMKTPASGKRHSTEGNKEAPSQKVVGRGVPGVIRREGKRTGWIISHNPIGAEPLATRQPKLTSSDLVLEDT
jgi:hypothetical protein